MRFESLERYGISPSKLFAIGTASGASSALLVYFVSSGVLVSSSLGVSIVVGVLTFYAVVTSPKRARNLETMSESREAPLLAVNAAAGFQATGSRARTLLMLGSKEKALESVLGKAKHDLLLGFQVKDVVEEAVGRVGSYSVANVLKSTASLPPSSILERGEEARGMEGAAELARESKVPVFMTICFFSPPLLVLFAAFSGISGPWGLAEIFVLLVVILDLAFYLCSGERTNLK